jgi:DNA-binding transcriptional MerR regulator
MGERLTVGDFSRATQLTIKTLRHYHEVGLLEPVEVDSATSYRCYARSQIPLPVPRLEPR